MQFQYQPQAFRGQTPLSLLPSIQQADTFFSAAYRALTEANAAGNAISALFGPVVGDAVSRPVGHALRTMELLWGAVDALAEEMPGEAWHQPWRLRDHMLTHGQLVELRYCTTSGCPQRYLLETPESSTCPPEHAHRVVYDYEGGEDPEPF